MYTKHGHHIPGTTLVARPGPTNVARCGGPRLCTQCQGEAMWHTAGKPYSNDYIPPWRLSFCNDCGSVFPETGYQSYQDYKKAFELHVQLAHPKIQETTMPHNTQPSRTLYCSICREEFPNPDGLTYKELLRLVLAHEQNEHGEFDETYTESKPADTPSLHIREYQRKPFVVEAVQVTEENFEEVAKWCGGSITTVQEAQTGILKHLTKRYISVDVHRPLSKRQTQAHVGDWVLHIVNKGFKVYAARPFQKNFDPVGQGFAKEDLETQPSHLHLQELLTTTEASDD